jgi:hypothetical protein
MASPSFCVVRLYYHDERTEARSTRLYRSIAVVAVVGVVSVTTVNAKQPEGRAFCRDPGFAASGKSGPKNPQLKPHDDAFRRPDFAAFRRQLQDAVARKDEEAVLRVVDAGVRVDFGDVAASKRSNVG